MPVITLTLSDAAAAEVIDAFCAEHSYSPVLGDGAPNPESRAQFARRMIVKGIKQTVLAYRRQQASATASAADPEITA